MHIALIPAVNETINLELPILNPEVLAYIDRVSFKPAISLTHKPTVAMVAMLFITGLFTGYFPTPVYFGAIINSTCTLWQYTCNERGSCWLYDKVSYRYAYFGTLLGLRMFSIICYAIMIWFLKDEYPDDQVSERVSHFANN